MQWRRSARRAWSRIGGPFKSLQGASIGLNSSFPIGAITPPGPAMHSRGMLSTPLAACALALALLAGSAHCRTLLQVTERRLRVPAMILRCCRLLPAVAAAATTQRAHCMRQLLQSRRQGGATLAPPRTHASARPFTTHPTPLPPAGRHPGAVVHPRGGGCCAGGPLHRRSGRCQRGGSQRCHLLLRGGRL